MTAKIDPRPPIAFVEWIDAGVIAANWRDLEESLGEGLDDCKDPIRSVGFVLHNDETSLVLAAGLNETHGDVQLAIFIPKSTIVRYDEWRPWE